MKKLPVFVKLIVVILCTTTLADCGEPNDTSKKAANSEYQQMLRRISSSKTTGEQHRDIILKAETKGWLIKLTSAYHTLAKQKVNEPIVQSAFGHSYSRLTMPNPYRPQLNHPDYVKITQSLYNSAHESLERAVQGKGKKIAFCWYALGWENVSPSSSSQNRKEGIKQLNKALEIDPRYVNAHYRLAFAYLVRDTNYSPAQSLKAAEAAAELEPNSAKPFYHQASANFYLKRYKTAYALLLKAEKMEPNSIAKWMLDLYKKKSTEAN